LLRESAQHIAHGDETQIDENFAQLLAAALLLKFERAIEILFANQFSFEEDLA
jgi:hypothetical protein